MKKFAKWIVAALVLVFAILMSISPKYKDLPTKKIALALSDETKLDSMVQFSNSRFKKDFSMNANEFVSVEYYGYEDIMDSETFLLVKGTDEAQLEALKASISERRSYLMEVFKSYAPENYDLLDRAVLEIRGDYLIFLVMDDSDRVFQSFLEEIRE